MDEREFRQYLSESPEQVLYVIARNLEEFIGRALDGMSSGEIEATPEMAGVVCEMQVRLEAAKSESRKFGVIGRESYIRWMRWWQENGDIDEIPGN